MIAPTPMVVMAAPDPMVVVEGTDDGTYRIEQKKSIGFSSEGQRHETFAVKVNNRWYRFADEMVPVKGADGHRYYFNDGDDNYDHDPYFSPDDRWLFVTRKCCHKVDVAYLFHFTRKRAVRVHPLGLRFDEAALKYFGRKIHFLVPALDSGGARITRFGHWGRSGRGFVFDLWEATDTQRQADETGIDITAYYSFQTGRFKLLRWQRRPS